MRLDEARSQARSILQDQRPPFRWSDSDLDAALLSCLAFAQRLRPDLFIGSYASPQTLLTPAQLAQPATQLPLPEPWVRMIPQGMASLCHMRDDEHAAPERIASLWESFLGGLK